MNRQKIFAKIKLHLLAQNEKSQDKDSSCQYRLRKNSKILKCAIGCLIQKKFYNKKFEGENVDCLKHQYVFNIEGQKLLKEALLKSLKIEKIDGDEVDFLHKLQEIHDVYSPSKWQKQLKKFARENNLEF